MRLMMSKKSIFLVKKFNQIKKIKKKDIIFALNIAFTI